MPASLIREPIKGMNGLHGVSFGPRSAFHEGFVEVQEHIADDRPRRGVEGIHLRGERAERFRCKGGATGR